jgi:deoxycytidine triphosphate deaminase
MATTRTLRSRLQSRCSGKGRTMFALRPDELALVTPMSQPAHQGQLIVISREEILGVYSNKEILAAMETGDIVIDPFNPKHLNTTSYDVTLGRYFFKAGDGYKSLYNPYDPEGVAKHFGEVMEAEPFDQHSSVHRQVGNIGLNNIDPSQRVIILRPGERILAHTQEFIGIRNQGTTSMHARSTTGRNGIVVCLDAGWGDTGYDGRWTMEIKNENEQFVVLPEGVRVAQIVFHHSGEVDGSYSELSGKYQTSKLGDLAARKASWRPEDMLPKSYLDTIEPLPAVEGLADGLV